MLELSQLPFAMVFVLVAFVYLHAFQASGDCLCHRELPEVPVVMHATELTVDPILELFHDGRLVLRGSLVLEVELFAELHAQQRSEGPALRTVTSNLNLVVDRRVSFARLRPILAAAWAAHYTTVSLVVRQ